MGSRKPAGPDCLSLVVGPTNRSNLNSAGQSQRHGGPQLDSMIVEVTPNSFVDGMAATLKAK